MDGYDATAEIRRREGTERHTPIVAMTAHTMKGDRERCLAAGMDDYLAKPLDPSMLDEILTRTLQFSDRPLATDTPHDDTEPAPVVVDQRSLAQICDGDTDARDQLVTLFLDQAGRAVAELARALAANDLEAVRLTSHALTGSAATLGAMRLGALTRRLCDDVTETMRDGHRSTGQPHRRPPVLIEDELGDARPARSARRVVGCTSPDRHGKVMMSPVRGNCAVRRRGGSAGSRVSAGGSLSSPAMRPSSSKWSKT
jgi:CheY-like chemotaxis protein